MFKRDETKLLNVSGSKCALCGFIELRSREGGTSQSEFFLEQTFLIAGLHAFSAGFRL